MDRRIGRPVCLASSNAPCDQGCQLISDARFGRGEKWNSAPASGMGEGYDGNVISTSAVDAYIEKNSRRFIGELKELCSFPSISNHGREAIQPARDWLAERLAKFTDRVETLEAGGMPALYAEVPGAGRRKLLLYEHYDVQPVDPIDLWTTPPLEPAERDDRIFARGVADDKADVMARIHALETLKQLGEVPVTLRFLIEGEEEIGSRSFEKLVRDPKPDQVIEQMLFLPTCNIAGITTGYQGPGSKTVLPAEATAKLDFRLIPNQDPDEVRELLRKHLDRHGFDRVEILAGEGEKPARSDPNSAVAKSVIECVREMHGEPVLWPFMPATGPMHPVVSDLEIPTVLPVGVGRPDNRIHAPNENIRAADYVNTVRLMCRIWERFGAS